ncbi:MAG: hypothetical protein JWM05_1045 [Acidimicrobiales bacterium]|nr:hypothetical protein [Acidimicrobiales bacterium]
MIPGRRPSPTSHWGHAVLATVALAVATVTQLGAGPAAAAERGASTVAAGGRTCRAVGRAAGSSTTERRVGAHRATVVVDTGDGVVWAACITFDAASISGRDALDLADGPIPGLNPTFDTYGGLGAAVCQLRSVGRPPPNCLSGGADYWGYWRNGRYSGAGASSTRVRDGDTEGWRWGRGEPLGAPTAGAVCAPSPPPTTQPPPTTPPPTVAPPPPGSTAPPGAPGGGPGLGVTPSGPTSSGVPPSTTPPSGNPSSTTTTTTSSTTSTSPAISTPVTAGGTGRTRGGSSAGSGRAESAGAGRRAAGERASASSSGRGLSSGAGSIIGFAAVLAVIVGLAVLARRRRAATGP